MDLVHVVNLLIWVCIALGMFALAAHAVRRVFDTVSYTLYWRGHEAGQQHALERLGIYSHWFSEEPVTYWLLRELSQKGFGDVHAIRNAWRDRRIAAIAAAAIANGNLDMYELPKEESDGSRV